jgi:hypothetical protein
MTRHRFGIVGSLLLVLASGLALPAALEAQVGRPGRDRRNDNDRQQRQRSEERDLRQFLFLQQLAQQQYLAQYLATLQAAEYWRMAHTGQFLPPPPRPAELVPAVGRVNARGPVPLDFRVAPGERELELGRLWRQVDAEKARDLFEQAARRAGDGSEVAEAARKELKALQPK